jgi:hypothetical protein
VEPTQRIINITDSLKDIDERWSFLFDSIGKLDKENGDIIHEIENSNYDVRRANEIYKRFREVRKQRRIYKNEQELLKPLYEYYQRNKKAFNELTGIRNGIVNIKKMQDNWIYNKRVKGSEIK